jgi:protein-S-isoprenylcysteine O-methyltransferase Ste14
MDPEFFVFKFNPFSNGLCAFVKSIWNTRVFMAYCAWVLFQWVLYLIVPGPVILGTELKNSQKTRLKYRINALRCFAVTVVVLGVLVSMDILPATFAYDYFLPMLTSSVVFSFILAILLYAHSVLTIDRDNVDADARPLTILSETGNADNLFYDFWMGRTLNPRLGFLDLKYVCELRPGLILWALMNFSMAAKQYALHGAVSPSMILVCLFHLYYVVDSHWSEPAILTTMDITTDGFGFMLCFGDLAWVPMNYTLQTRYLVDHDPHLPWWVLVAIVLLKVVGMYIFRASNSQKNTFRTNPTAPEVANLEAIQTQRGTRLLVSGWWGLSRHMNYLGDLLMGLAWCLPTGFNAITPYFYAVYFTALLINRQIRDDHKCQLKYGKDWDTYCERVPYRIVPYVY